MHRNIPLFFVAELLRSLYFAYAVATLFYQAIGIDYTGLGMLWVAMAVVQIALEIPCGVLSDRIGHRATVLLAYLAFAAALALIGSGTGLLLPLAGSAMWGVSAALLSGAADAFLFESLKASARQDQYLRYKGYHSALTSLGIIAGAIPGAYLYAAHLRAPWYAQSAAVIVAAAVFAFTRNPPLSQEHGGELQGVRDCARLLLARRDLLWLSLFMTLGILPLYGLSMVRQPYLVERTWAVVHLGYVFAGIEALGVALGLAAGWAERRLGAERSLLLTVVTMIGLLLALGLVPGKWAVAPLAAVYMCFRFRGIVLNAYSNRRIPSERRATILSVQAMGGSLLMIGFMLASGVMLDHLPLNTYMLTMAGYAAATLVPLWLLRHRFELEA
jgi:MFS family permease